MEIEDPYSDLHPFVATPMRQLAERINGLMAEKDSVSMELASQMDRCRAHVDQNDALVAENRVLKETLENRDQEYAKTTEVLLEQEVAKREEVERKLRIAEEATAQPPADTPETVEEKFKQAARVVQQAISILTK